MWTDYFPKATIYGADISPASQICESYSSRVKFHLLDQRDEAQLKNLEQFSPFDFIIDDGNHYWMEQILTFKTLFPYIRKGGIYFVEFVAPAIEYSGIDKNVRPFAVQQVAAAGYGAHTP